MAFSEADFMGLANRASKAQQAINALGAGPPVADEGAMDDYLRWLATVQSAPQGSIVIPAVLVRVSEHEIHLSFPTLQDVDIDVPLSDEQYDRLSDVLPPAPPHDSEDCPDDWMPDADDGKDPVMDPNGE